MSIKLFDIFIKKSKIVLDCFTTNRSAYNLFPISKAVNFIPKWWRDIPKEFTYKNNYVDYIPVPTMKACPGFTEFYNQGIIIPLWSDLIIKTNENEYSYQFADRESKIEEHGAYQYNYNFPYFYHLKISNPWFFKTKKLTSFFYTNPFWNTFSDFNLTNNFYFISGILEFKYQNVAHINAFVTKKINRFEFNAGIPFAYLYPKTEKEVCIKKHCIDSAEHEKLFVKNKAFFSFAYKKDRHLSN